MLTVCSDLRVSGKAVGEAHATFAAVGLEAWAIGAQLIAVTLDNSHSLHTAYEGRPARKRPASDLHCAQVSARYSRRIGRILTRRSMDPWAKLQYSR